MTVRVALIVGSLRKGSSSRAIGMALFGRKGVALQPVEQRAAVARDHVELRAVHMGVDEPRQDQPAAVIDALPAGVRTAIRHRVHRSRGERVDDSAVLDHQPVVGAPAQAVRTNAQANGNKRWRRGKGVIRRL